VDTLIIKCKRALKQTQHKTIVIAGGVSANIALRSSLNALPNINAYFPRPEFCSDNGAMIAFAGAMRQSALNKQDKPSFAARPRWPLDQLKPA
ncbi:MAG: tRNA (adenosine(37)-N6)-threonylcarbamoyltransferase complex transferase subunit TsaD, partial [Gammaproteobacteria bacterium]|nr:tRNA (adenosine(37)-N6)-threonylcarbamoyltransferase complex transferase subunit TsaD [Gammaproteobacteria bacterium]